MKIPLNKYLFEGKGPPKIGWLEHVGMFLVVFFTMTSFSRHLCRKRSEEFPGTSS